MLHCSVHLLLYSQPQRRTIVLRREWHTHTFWLIPQSFNTCISALLSIPFDHSQWSYRLYFWNFVGFFLIFSKIFLLFPLPTRSGIINCKGNDFGRQWLTVQEGEDAAPVGTGITVGPWDSDVDRTDELSADNRREKQMLTKTLSTVLMAWVRSNNIFTNTFSNMHLICSYSHTSKMEQKCQD